MSHHTALRGNTKCQMPSLPRCDDSLSDKGGHTFPTRHPPVVYQHHAGPQNDYIHCNQHDRTMDYPGVLGCRKKPLSSVLL
jgi:hypothetical protein